MLYGNGMPELGGGHCRACGRQHPWPCQVIPRTVPWSTADPGYQADGKKRYPVDNRGARPRGQLVHRHGQDTPRRTPRTSCPRSRARSTRPMASTGSAPTWWRFRFRNGRPPPPGRGHRGGSHWLARRPGTVTSHEHGSFNGTTATAHMITMTHAHEHTQVGDSSHGSQMHGSNPNQKAYAAKGMAWAGAWRLVRRTR